MTDTDVVAGKRLRLRRVALGLTQREVAAILGVTFQQLQKYERGTNRISAGRLEKLAGILDVPISYFFTAAPELQPHDTPERQETRDLLTCFAKIGSRSVRRAVRRLLQAIKEAEQAAVA